MKETLSRRSLLLCGVVSGFAAAGVKSKTADMKVEEQRADPGSTPETIEFNPQLADALVSYPTKAQIIDRQQAFPAELIRTARDFVGHDRYHDEGLVSDLLALFHVPFRDASGKYNAFCACGIAYCAAQTYSRLAWMTTLGRRANNSVSRTRC